MRYLVSRILAMLCAALIVSACAGRVGTDYSKTDLLPEDLNGKTIYFAQAPSQNGSTAWEGYIRQISAEMNKLGLVRVGRDDRPDYLAHIVYGAGNTRTETSAMPLFGQTGGGISQTTGTITGTSGFNSFRSTTTSPTTYGVTGYVPVTRSKTDRFFAIEIFDVAKSTGGQLAGVYEATVYSTGRAQSFDLVAGCMIKSLMDDFRGSESDGSTMLQGAEC